MRVLKMPLDIVKETQQLLGQGETKLMDVLPAAIKRLIHDRAWEGRTKRVNLEIVPFENFEDLVTTSLPWGLETTISDLRLYCKKAPDVLKMIDWAVRKSCEVEIRAEKSKKFVEEGLTQQQIAEKLGVCQKTVSNDLVKNTVRPKKITKPKRKRIRYEINSGTKTEDAAKNIVETFGVEFALSLAEGILNYH